MCERSSDKKLRPRTAQVPSERTPVNLIGERVINQARRRVLDGEQVPYAEKIYSIFEPIPT